MTLVESRLKVRERGGHALQPPGMPRPNRPDGFVLASGRPEAGGR